MGVDMQRRKTNHFLIVFFAKKPSRLMNYDFFFLPKFMDTVLSLILLVSEMLKNPKANFTFKF